MLRSGSSTKHSPCVPLGSVICMCVGARGEEMGLLPSLLLPCAGYWGIFIKEVINGPVLLYWKSVVPRMDDVCASKGSGLVEGEEEEGNLSIKAS